MDQTQKKTASIIKQTPQQEVTYGAAPKALFLVSDLIAENVLVMTATKRLINQKLSTTMQTMKKQHETKNSASIMEYISGDHLGGKSVSVSEFGGENEISHPVCGRYDYHLKRSVIYRIETLHIPIWILTLLNQQVGR